MATLSSKLTTPSLAHRFVIAATEGQTVLENIKYTIGSVDVFLNGVKLVDGDDFTATNGVSITLTNPAVLNDAIEVNSYTALAFADLYLKEEVDAMLDNVYDDINILDLGV